MVRVTVRTTSIAAWLLACIVLAGCSSAHQDDVERAAKDFRAALKAEDGAKACEELSDDAQEELRQSSGSSCTIAVLDTDVPTDGRVERVSVSGTAAQVRYGDDIVFLAEFSDGWRVIAAGCRTRPDKPYDCEIQGG